jgi:polysaccharide deacetylase 2 family uncharacterized protein YibQ
MSKKKKLPFWLVIVLAIILAVLLIIVGMVSSDKNEPLPVHKDRLETVFEEMTPQTEPVPMFEAAPEATPEPIPEPELPPSPVITPGKGIALVMDDVGYDLNALKRILNLSVPVAISVLPGAPFARESASLSHQHGQTVMLHLPMEPLVPKYQKRMTDTFLRVDMTESELRQTFLLDLEKIPHVEGVNNHMGSRLTQLEQPMSWVMQICKEKGLFFVDSKTSGASVAADLASSMGIAWASRRYFLDHQIDEQAMEQAWNNARACAEKGLRCIVIAHPHKETISFLEKHLTKDDMTHMLPVKHLLRITPSRLGKSQGDSAMEQQL